MWPFNLLGFSKKEPELELFKLIGNGLVQKYPSAAPGEYSLVKIYEFAGKRFFRDYDRWTEIEARHKLIMDEETEQ